MYHAPLCSASGSDNLLAYGHFHEIIFAGREAGVEISVSQRTGFCASFNESNVVEVAPILV